MLAVFYHLSEAVTLVRDVKSQRTAARQAFTAYEDGKMVVAMEQGIHSVISLFFSDYFIYSERLLQDIDGKLTWKRLQTFCAVEKREQPHYKLAIRDPYEMFSTMARTEEEINEKVEDISVRAAIVKVPECIGLRSLH